MDEKRKTLFSSFHFVRYCVTHKSWAREYYQAFFSSADNERTKGRLFCHDKNTFCLTRRTQSHTRTHTYTHTHIHTHTHTYTHTYTNTHAHKLSFTHTQTHTCSHTTSLLHVNTHTLSLTHRHTAFSPCSTSGGGEKCSLIHAAMAKEGPLTIFRVFVDLTVKESVWVCVSSVCVFVRESLFI